MKIPHTSITIRMKRNHDIKYAESYYVNQTGLPSRHRSLWCVGHSTRIILDYSSASFRIFLSDHSKHLADLFKLLQCHEAHLWFYRVEEVDNLLGPNVSGRDTIYFMPSTLSTRKAYSFCLQHALHNFVLQHGQS